MPHTHTHTVPVHVSLKALPETTGAALVAVRLVYRTIGVLLCLRFAGVHAIPVDAPLEETRAPCVQSSLTWLSINYTLNLGDNRASDSPSHE